MKKSAILIIALVFGLMASTAFAAAGANDRSNEKHGKETQETQETQKAEETHDKRETGDAEEEKEHKEDEEDKEDQAKVKVEKDKGKAKGGTVTDSVYGDDRESDSGHDDEDKKDKKGAKGLLNAHENVKGKPAGDRIAKLLKIKYNINVNAEISVTDVVYSLEKDGDLKAAADVQAEAVAEDPADIDGYKKLSKLKTKLGDKYIKTYVNGRTVSFDVPPVAEGGRTLVPFRAISESLKADVTYDPATKTITVKRDNVEVKLKLGSKIATVNGKEVTLDVPGKVKDNRVLVPLRFLSEALDTDVTWDAETSSAIIVNKTPEAEASVQ
ncbi:MAG TPA: copper amine oxidase N-terminal domain-containing protein [Paenibacillus sp.]|uniref:copper amine oxidase N-terminal domain-containing protein n=1 Tax=Paenibacillus sp. TaxID=58172 RepID=UPI002C6DBEAC|nr:copper amine oxidase N-terminal domain-containing protein [Paenibacillus sp.]HUC92181.1 copper amine oxidase N-terminal domain-containing protein [Paenibacillus sp.]